MTDGDGGGGLYLFNLRVFAFVFIGSQTTNTAGLAVLGSAVGGGKFRRFIRNYGTVFFLP